tara:strand:- start:617 stop:1096 length:480 start_codon:yes stop_codon:yes gene_type:complete
MYQKILIPLDGSELAECVLPHVEFMAKSSHAQSVTFIYVIKPAISAFSDSEEGISWLPVEDTNRLDSEAKTAAERYLTQLLSGVKYDGVDIQLQIIFGDQVADVIADYATKNEVDLIIISTHGRSGIGRWVWGSVADRVLRTACIPVMMVRAPGCIPGI